jgi:hypothetical protein
MEEEYNSPGGGTAVTQDKRRCGRAAGSGTMNKTCGVQDLGSVSGWQQQRQDTELQSLWHEKRAGRVIGDWKDQRSSCETHTDR